MLDPAPSILANKAGLPVAGSNLSSLLVLAATHLNSCDELGAKPTSMISLGGVSSNFSASDLHKSLDGSADQKTLIIKDDRQLPVCTHFVHLNIFFQMTCTHLHLTATG